MIKGFWHRWWENRSVSSEVQRKSGSGGKYQEQRGRIRKSGLRGWVTSGTFLPGNPRKPTKTLSLSGLHRLCVLRLCVCACVCDSVGNDRLSHLLLTSYTHTHMKTHLAVAHKICSIISPDFWLHLHTSTITGEHAQTHTHTLSFVVFRCDLINDVISQLFRFDFTPFNVCCHGRFWLLTNQKTLQVQSALLRLHFCQILAESYINCGISGKCDAVRSFFDDLFRS